MFCCLCVHIFFFFKQKTAYEMRISDWSSDVCSSDLDSIMGNLDFLRDLTGDRTEVPPFDRVFFGNEKGYAGYVQGRYAFDLGSMTVDGLVGLRAVRTETEIKDRKSVV